MIGVFENYDPIRIIVMLTTLLCSLLASSLSNTDDMIYGYTNVTQTSQPDNPVSYGSVGF